MKPTITGTGRAVPASLDQQQLWDEYFKEHYQDHRVARSVWQNSGIRTRHGVVDPRGEDIPSWSTSERMQRYVHEARPLGYEAVAEALKDAGVSPADVGMLTVVSCTGYSTPGLDILLADDLGMSPETQRLVIGHMGCYAALPGLGAVADHVQVHQRPAVMLCIELTSLHLQPSSIPGTRPSPADVEQMVAHSLFSDAAAAVVVEPGSRGGLDLEVVDTIARTDVTTADHMRWDITDLGFKMGLSPKVPEVLGRHAHPTITALLERNGLTTRDVTGWAIHPGGRKIVEVVGEALSLTAEDLGASYRTLAEHGNCSSATVLLVLEELLEEGRVQPGGWVVATAFGPGLTLYATLLRRRS